DTMQIPTMWEVELGAWYAIAIVWALSALAARKDDKITEPVAARLFTLAYAAAALALLFSRSLPFGWLYRTLLPAAEWREWLGVAITYVGAAVAIWARVALGANWSARVQLKVGHELVRRGPYAYVRHPIYTGFLLAVIGTAIEIGEVRGLLA